MAQRISDDDLQDTINAYHGNGKNQVITAQHLGIARSTLQNRLELAAERGIKFQPINSHAIGQSLKGVSQYYKRDPKTGEAIPAGFWVKGSKDAEAMRAALDAVVKSMCEDIPRQKLTPPPKHTNSDLASLYVITDYHFGQLSWGEETGADWDLKIAEETLIKWFSTAISLAPDSKVGVLAQLGDFMHTDGWLAMTPTSGNLLDADSRFPKIVQTCVRALRSVVNLMLLKHDEVHLILAEGNHDLASSVWLRTMFAALYENEPRVKVDTSSIPYYCFEWGQTALFFHHGHKRKVEDLSMVFTGLFREVIGRTKYAYGHSGHMHHQHVKEDQIMVMRQHPTLAAMDAHSARLGYRSLRTAPVITYSKKFGRVAETEVSPEMVK